MALVLSCCLFVLCPPYWAQMEMLNSTDAKKVEQFLKMMKIFHDNISLIILVWIAGLRALHYGSCTLKWIRGHLLCIVGDLHPACSFSLLPVTEGFTFWTEICLIIFYVILWLYYTEKTPHCCWFQFRKLLLTKCTSALEENYR